MRIDWHLHSCLSPCASLEMSPERIAREALVKGLDLIGLTDHNSARNAPAFAACCRKAGIAALFGLEITTAEECHVLALFDSVEAATRMDAWVRDALPRIPLDSRTFGDQPVVDTNGMVIEMVDVLLISAIRHSMAHVGEQTHKLGGLFIPSHITRHSFSIESQLGFLPPGNYDALEADPDTVDICRKRYPGMPIVTASDAHFPEDIGHSPFDLETTATDIPTLRAALHNR